MMISMFHWLVHVFLSTNNGTSWIDYGLPGPPRDISLAIDSSGYVWAGAHLDGVYKTAGRTVPVELASFSAEVNGNNVLLNWATASEINNQGFEIERSEKSKNRKYNDSWEKIGFVNGNGTTTEINLIVLLMKMLANGTYLYRLKQIDFDGSYEYSKTIEVEC